MREILFRGFSEYKYGEEKAFYGDRWHEGKWFEGFFHCVVDTYSLKRCWCITTFKELDNGEIIYTGQYEVIPETVGQYTGLLDKNNKKIWENDIVKTIYDGKQNPNYVVVWDKDELDFKATNGQEHYKTNYAYLGSCDEIVVIGNIHSNPELLEVK